MSSSRKEQAFSVVKRAKSFTHAGRGVYLLVKTTHNAWIHLVALVAVVAAGFYFGISHIEWALVVLAIGLVLSAEAFNTAIEIDIDLTSPQYHPYARDTKDVAAGAVLLASIAAGIVGVLVFGPHILSLV